MKIDGSIPAVDEQFIRQGGNPGFIVFPDPDRNGFPGFQDLSQIIILINTGPVLW
jgi:hypothetical protein